ncbi:MAG: phosphoglycerate dehydrogenase [Armatimonadetes bacterium]|nr:phosphoglycerate dehydrogenase [Armatimonadota bacterium]MDW8154626.1 phosphoglycerate dehydrogenase [Armatimonadota bacterium]
MSAWRVLVTSRSFLEAAPEAARRLEEAGVELLRAPADRPLEEEEMAGLLGEVDGIVAGVDRIGRRALQKGAPRLRVIARVGVGVDTIDLQAATELGVVVTNTPGANAEAVAELAFGLMIVLARGILSADRGVREGRWVRPFGVELFGKCLGVVGFGHIGQAVARRGVGFGMEVVASDPLVDPEVARTLGVALVPFPEVVARADFLTLHVPLLPETQYLVGEAELRRMKPTAYLINTSRGGVVDEAALTRALQEGWIAGAACDVFEEEPPVRSPLLQAPNVVLTPHVGGHTREAAARAARQATEQVLAVLRGERPPHVVNPEVFERR